MGEHIIRVDAVKCIGCGLCKGDCPENNIEIREKKAIIKAQNCIKCGHCAAICPKAAVSITGFEEQPMEFKEKTTVDHQQLLQALRTRRSVRQFQNRPVSHEVIDQIIEAGRLTPTAKNAQKVSYLVLMDQKDHYEKLAVRFFRKLLPFARLFYPPAKKVDIDDHFFFKKAPAAILIMAHDQVDGALAASNMALMAEANGLGVLYSGFFTIAANFSRALPKALGIRRQKVVTTLVVGYPDVVYHRTAPKESAAVRFL